MGAVNFINSLSVLYLQANAQNKINRSVVSVLSKNLLHAEEIEDALHQYQSYIEKNQHYIDIVLIDSSFGVEAVKKFFYINSNQNIIINLEIGHTDKEIYAPFKITHFISEPFHGEDIKDKVNKLIAQNDTNSLLQRNMQEYKKLDQERSKVLQNYESRILELENKLQRQGDFFAAISHEFRTPLNAIMGISDVLMQDQQLSEKHRDNVKMINNSSQMLLGLVNDILDFSKIEAGKLELEETPFLLSSVLEYVADMISMKTEEKGIEFIYNIEHGVVNRFIGDPLRLSQVLLNLVSNAVKFTQKGSVTLHVKTLQREEEEDIVEFEVRDTGIGIKAEKLAHLFQNYTQADTDTSRKYGGTGLGLSISKKLAQLMDGDIRVESEYEKGSSFFVSVRLKKDKVDGDTRRIYRLESTEVMSKKALVLCTQPMAKESLLHKLRYFHIEIDSTEEMDEIKNFTADLLFIEEELFNALHATNAQVLERFERVIIIENWMSSLKSSPENKEGYHILKKPFNQQMVFDLLNQLYGSKELQEKKKAEKKTKEDLDVLRSQKILVADDNTINQHVISALLDKSPLKPVFVENGKEVLNELFISEYPYKIILMDIFMPKLNGYEATIKIRENKDFDDVIIVALTGDVTQESIEKSQEAGMQGHLAKPIEPSKLYTILLESLQ